MAFPDLARLTKAILHAERAHATSHLRALGHIQSAGENLQAAIDGERYEVHEMYPFTVAIAEQQNGKGAAKTEPRALEAEKIHTNLYGDEASG